MLTNREPLLHLLLQQRERCLRAQSFFERHEKLDETWFFDAIDPLIDDLEELIVPDYKHPSDIVSVVVETLDEYIRSIEGFGENEWRAFLLGLGLNWLPLSYWGSEHLERYLTKVRKARLFYSEMERKIPSDDVVSLRKPHRFFLEIPGILPRPESLPSEILSLAETIIEMMYTSLVRSGPCDS